MSDIKMDHYKKSLNHIVWADQTYDEYKHLVSSLITTIESQKEEIERLKSAIEQATRELPYGNSAYKILLKSLYPESFKAQGGDK